MDVVTKHENLRLVGGTQLSAVPRTTGAALTRPASLADVWPDVGPRLQAMLRRLGLDPATAQDVAQETAARAIAREVPYTDADDLFRWASVVARRIAIDLRRRHSRIDLAPVPDAPAASSTAAQVEHRLDLEAVRSAFSKLSDADRDAIRTAVVGDPRAVTRREATRLAVRRHRARSRLAALVGGVIAALSWLRRAVTARTSRPVVLIAAMSPLVVGALLVLPHLHSPRTLPAVGASASDRTILSVKGAPGGSAATRLLSAAPAGASAAPRSPTAPPVTRMAPSSGIHEQLAIHALPGYTSTLGTRPGRPDDEFACVDVTTAVHRCVDRIELPVP